MSQYRKVLIDRNLGIGLKEAFDRCNAPVTITMSSDVVAKGARADDVAILLYAHESKMHVITSDNHFGRRGPYPCNQSIYAGRTVVMMPLADMDLIAKTLLTAWREIGWDNVKSSPLLEVHEKEATLYRCDERQFVPIKPPFRF